MRRWTAWFAAVLLACIPIFLQRSNSPDLLRDTDTSVLLTTIRQQNAPFSWFVRDWPLQNHFYRPVSTLVFEADNRLYGTRAWGYGLTNDLLAICCVLLVFWFLLELTGMAPLAASAAILFAFWHVGFEGWLLEPAALLTWLAAIGGLFRHGFKWPRWLPPALVLWFVRDALYPLGQPSSGVLGWIPGRTATVMTVFALISLSGYARYERLAAVRSEITSDPLKSPATRGSVQVSARPRFAVWWVALSVLSLALSLGSYEQAVMVPALLLGVAVTMKLLGFRVNWKVHGLFWGVLVAYLGVRYSIVPSAPSQYQLQQFRHGPGVYEDLAEYILPAAGLIPMFLATIQGGWLALMDPKLWAFLISASSQVAALCAASRRLPYVLCGYLMSILAFLPMAWLKRFEHYHYLPMAFRSLFVVSMAWIAIDGFASAVSPPTSQAPQRQSPSPGSLPHP